MLSDAAMPAVGGFFLMHATTFQQQKKIFCLSVTCLMLTEQAEEKKKLGELGNQQSVRVLEK